MQLPPEVLARLEEDEIQSPKGPVLQTAIIAGTMAAKKTSELIPFCHLLGLTGCSFTTEFNKQRELIIECVCKIDHKKGVEMEALTGATAAALTVYDMCKALSHDIVVA